MGRERGHYMTAWVKYSDFVERDERAKMWVDDVGRRTAQAIGVGLVGRTGRETVTTHLNRCSR
jgi:hypothetical protein